MLGRWKVLVSSNKSASRSSSFLDRDLPSPFIFSRLGYPFDWTYYISPKKPVLVCSPFWMLSWKVLSAREEFMRIWARSSSKSSFRREGLLIVVRYPVTPLSKWESKQWASGRKATLALLFRKRFLWTRKKGCLTLDRMRLEISQL